MKIERASAYLLVVLLAGLALRSVGFTRGSSDFVLPNNGDIRHETTFYAFHPDEISLIDGALKEFDLFSPPYTSYGTLPPYLLGGLLRLFDLHGGYHSLSGAPPDARRSIYYVARVLTILFSMGVLILTAILARKLYGNAAALAATAIVAFAPGAIQQAHFFITDGAFALASLAALLAILRATEGERDWFRFLLAGGLIGATTCIRFNGALLGLALVAVLWIRTPGSIGFRSLAILREPRIWGTALLAVGLLLSLHPYILTQPELLSRAKYVGDFTLAMKYASLKYLQPWTLVDAHIIPYLSHWFGMWPLVVGWPLTIGFLLALTWAFWRGGWQERVLAAWCLLYFLPVGMLASRAVRHLVPLLAIFSVLSVGGVRDLLPRLPQPRLRRGFLLLCIGLGVHLFIYGTAFARIYLIEDSRIRAGRFLQKKVAPGISVAVESGAFTMAPQVDSDRYPRGWMEVSMLLYSGPYMLCADRVDYLQGRLRPAGAAVYVEENRAFQYAAVPELFPVAASFYEQLSSSRLGLDIVRRFKTHPEFAGIRFTHAGADPTLTGYDHPAVNVMMLRDDADFATTFGRWRQEMMDNPWCPDKKLAEAAAQLLAGNTAIALATVQETIAANPNALISYRMEAEILHRMGDTEGFNQAMRRFQPETAGGRMAHVMNPDMVHFVTASTAISLIRLGLYDAALQELHAGLRQDFSKLPRARESRASSYLRAAARFGATDQPQRQLATVRMSLKIFETSDALNVLAKFQARGGDLLASRGSLQQSILLQDEQPQTHLALAELFLAVDPDFAIARVHLNRAESLDNSLSERVQELLRRIDAALRYEP